MHEEPNDSTLDDDSKIENAQSKSEDLLASFERHQLQTLPQSRRDIQVSEPSNSSTEDSKNLLVWDFAEASDDVFFRIDLKTGDAQFSPNVASLLNEHPSNWGDFATRIYSSDRSLLEGLLNQCSNGTRDSFAVVVGLGSCPFESRRLLFRAHIVSGEQTLAGQIAVLNPEAPLNSLVSSSGSLEENGFDFSAPIKLKPSTLVHIRRGRQSGYEVAKCDKTLRALFSAYESSPVQLFDLLFDSIPTNRIDDFLDSFNTGETSIRNLDIPLKLTTEYGEDTWEISNFETIDESNWQITIVERNKKRSLMEAAVKDSIQSVILLDKQANPIYLNDHCSRLLGFNSASRLAECGGIKVLFQEPKLRRQISDSIQKGSEWRGSATVNGLSNRRIQAKLVSKQLIHEDGSPIGQALYFEDESQQYHEHDEHQFQQTLYRQIIDLAPIGIWLTSKDGSVPILNKYIATRTGWSTPCCSITEEQRAIGIANDRKVSQQDEVLRTQETYTFIDGKEHTFNVVKTKALDHEGNKIGVLAMAVDTTAISEQQQQIDDFREAKDLLTQQLSIAVESATAAQDSARKANQAKNAFLTTMSHEMRTPLNGIIGMTDMLMDTALESDQREMLSTIELSGQSLLHIVNDILDFTNIEACSDNYDTESLVLREQIESAIDAFSGSNNPNDLNISYWIEPSIPEVVKTNSSYLHQILHRLIDNAIKFTRSGDVEISCSALRLTENRSQIRINISDTGIGIPQDKVQTIFNSFSQADSSNTRRYGGTGIGLAIARKTAQRMGGDITVESEVDRGSTFKATFEVEHDQTHAGPAFESSPVLQDKYVLIADNDPISQEILKKYLTQWGAKTEIASNWTEASHLLSSFGRYDLVCACESIVEEANSKFEHALYVSGIERVAMRLKHGSKKDDEPWALSYASPIKGKFLKEICETLLSEETLFEPNVKLSNFADDRPLKILLAEDNKMNQKVVTMMGRSLGYDISIASSGQEAIQAVNSGNFDLVLMDIQMPDMDGLEATRIIRSSTTLSTQPYIVAVTSSALEESRKASEKAGMNAFAIKPLIRDTMVKHLIAAHQSIHGPN